jgi:hypothetical protein
MSSEKTLEMRVAAIEDKLAQSSVTPEEMRAFQKVSSLAGSSAATALSPILCTSCVGTCVHVITISVPVGTTCHIGPCGIATQAAQSQGGGPGFGDLGK